MQKKMESELANRIAQKRRLWSPRQLGALVVTAAACALIVGVSASALPIAANGSGNGNCPVSFVDLITGESDYLVPEVDAAGVPTGALAYASDWDSSYSVMRTVNLKASTFKTPGPVYQYTYTKWSYTTSVKLQDISMLETVTMSDGTTQIAAVHLGTLVIDGVDEATLYPVQWSITLNGVEMDLSLSSYAAYAQEVQEDGTTTMTVDITLPQYAYAAGNEVGILVQFRAYMVWNASEGFSEVGFPEFPAYVAPVLTE